MKVILRKFFLKILLFVCILLINSILLFSQFDNKKIKSDVNTPTENQLVKSVFDSLLVTDCYLFQWINNDWKFRMLALNYYGTNNLLDSIYNFNIDDYGFLHKSSKVINIYNLDKYLIGINNFYWKIFIDDPYENLAYWEHADSSFVKLDKNNLIEQISIINFSDSNKNCNIDYIYNINKLLNEKVKIYYNLDSLGQITNNRKTSYVYNKNILTDSILSRWNGIKWTEYSKYHLGYDSLNNIISNINYNPYDTNWVYSDKKDFIFDSTHGLIKLEFDTKWDYNKNIWVNYKKIHYEYYPDNRLYRQITEKWDGLKWTNSLRTTWAISDSTIEYYSESGQDSLWSFDYKAVYHFRKLTNISDEINLEITDFQDNEIVEVFICNLLGEIIFQSSFPYSTEKLSLYKYSNSLPNGIYFLVIKNDRKTNFQKFLKFY